METSVLAPGTVVAGKYALKRPLARGAMGEVWIATHRTLGNEVAVKFLARSNTHEGEDEATAMARFQFEAQVASKLSRRTRHIVAVTDHGEELGFAYLVMELVEGESLETLMRREGRATLPMLAPIVAQIAKGLGAAHAEGVFHRDLKPANVLLTKDEDGKLLVKVLDFGIAKTVRSHKIENHTVGHTTEVGIVLGTPNYMSPEQARGLASLDHRCDLWALCTIIYESLCSALPYDGETTADLLVNICSVDPTPVGKHRNDLPPALDGFFQIAFASNVRDRFQDAATLAAAFAQIVESAHPKPRLEVVELKSERPPADAAPARMATSRSTTGAVNAVAYEPPRSRVPIFVGVVALALIAVVVLLARGGHKSEPAAASAPVASESAAPTLMAPPHLDPTPPPIAPPTLDPEPLPTPKATTSVPAKSKGNAHPTVTQKPAASVTAPPAVTTAPPSTTQKPPDKGEIL